MKKSMFIFDMNKCVGCQACVVACHNTHGTSVNMAWREISIFNEHKNPEQPVFYYSLACNHCQDAPCKKNCPALAYKQDKKSGAIIHHAKNCIGCKYCTWTCPYDAPKYSKNEGIISKCTFCVEKIQNFEKPSCALLCPTGALSYVQKEVIDKSEINAPAFINRGISPSIYVTSLQKLKAPEIDKGLFTEQKTIEIIRNKEKINAFNEWSLILFTIIASLMVGIYWASPQIKYLNKDISFIGLGVIASLLSSMHLGKKTKAWRSILNIKNSWLSREIASFSFFFVLGTFSLLLNHLIFLKYISFFLCFATLISIDCVYYINEHLHSTKIHSSLVVLTGCLIISVLNKQYEATIAITATKVILFLWRKFFFIKNGIAFDLLTSSIRIICSFLSILILWYSDKVLLALTPLLIGELMDRIDFYNEMYVITPQRSLNHLASQWKNK